MEPPPQPIRRAALWTAVQKSYPRVCIRDDTDVFDYYHMRQLQISHEGTAKNPVTVLRNIEEVAKDLVSDAACTRLRYYLIHITTCQGKSNCYIFSWVPGV